MIEKQKAYLVGTHRGSFRAGKPAEILGVVFITPEVGKSRACYCILFDDSMVDYVPLSEAHNFEIISEEDVQYGRIPKVIH